MNAVESIIKIVGWLDAPDANEIQRLLVAEARRRNQNYQFMFSYTQEDINAVEAILEARNLKNKAARRRAALAGNARKHVKYEAFVVEDDDCFMSVWIICTEGLSDDPIQKVNMSISGRVLTQPEKQRFVDYMRNRAASMSNA